jgi:transcriptional regulator with XRE-family HTH domain
VAAMQWTKLISSVEIGEIIRKRRIALGITQEQLAEVLDVSYQQVQRYESGVNKLNVEKIQLVAEALSFPLISFFTAGHEDKVAETSPSYGNRPDEEKTLLKYFRRIKDPNDKEMVIDVARLAAKKRTAKPG